MTLDNFIEGLLTLRPYYTGDQYPLGAEHDLFFAYATTTPMTPEDVQKMRDLGWFQEGGGDDYDPDESWSARL